MSKLNRMLMDMKDSLATAGDKFSEWFRNAISQVFQLAVFTTGTYLIVLAGLWAFSIFWTGYADTHVGMKFRAFFPERSAAISAVVNQNIYATALTVTRLALETCLIISGLTQLISLRSYIYTYRGIFSRFLICGVACALITSYRVREALELPWQAALITGSLSAILIFTFCFNFVGEVIPELQHVFGLNIPYLLRKLQIRKKNRKQLRRRKPLIKAVFG